MEVTILLQLLEINHRKVRQLEVKHQNEVRQLQERLGQEEESVIALREEGRMKEQQIAKLKKSLKEVILLYYLGKAGCVLNLWSPFSAETDISLFEKIFLSIRPVD